MKIENIEELVSNLKHKKTYMVHIKNVDQALKHGRKYNKKGHRVISFEQSCWMRPYAMLNTNLSTAAKNEFEKDFFNNRVNRVFGKTVENIRSHKELKLVTSREKYAKYVIRTNFKDGYQFSKELLEMRKTEIKMDKPVYLGQEILDLGKSLMYKIYYDYMQPKYERKVKLYYSGTDSFVYEIEIGDFHRDIA